LAHKSAKQATGMRHMEEAQTPRMEAPELALREIGEMRFEQHSTNY